MKSIVLSAIKKENLILLLFVNSCPHALQKRAVGGGRHQKKEVGLLLESEDVLQAVAIQPAFFCNLQSATFMLTTQSSPSPKDDTRLPLPAVDPHRKLRKVVLGVRSSMVYRCLGAYFVLGSSC